MTMTKFTGNGSQETIQELYCSSDLTGDQHYGLICIALNTFLSITSLLGNTLILVVLNKESSLHPPSKLLLRCLVTTDLLVGLVSEPLYVIHYISAMNKFSSICRYSILSSFIAGYILSSVSLLTLTAISVDRLLALLLGLRYRQIVTLKRTFVIVISFWVVSTLAATMYLWNYLVILWYCQIGIALCLVTSSLSYSKIFVTLRHHQRELRDHTHQEQPNQLNITRYKKAVSSALWLQLTLLACYLPHGIMLALISHRGLSEATFVGRQFTTTLVNLNSSLNPILYCWKIREVRKAVKGTIRQLCCSFS